MNAAPMEREPDFEDDKVSVWRREYPGANPQDDPTVLRVDVEHEEPYESRVYRIRPSLGNLAILSAIAAHAASGQPRFTLPVALALSETFLKEVVVKFLSKRERGTGEITLLIVGTGVGKRFLLRPLRTFTLQGYEEKVVSFEQEWVAAGLLTAGPVIGHDDWVKYQNERE